ncbi:UDP-glucuronosyltransferase 2C1-like [Amphiura filiformis]|uniref:UDP-glucuronosyltransferase 2C1-like n=1 Tax=Amphiura filiformis TaxID=82378 RepID=UPI003B21CCB0
MKDSPYVKDFNAVNWSWYNLRNPEQVTQKINFLNKEMLHNGIELAGFKLDYGEAKISTRDCRDLFNDTELLLKLKSHNYNLIDLEEFVQGSGDHGIIIFTLGSMVGSLADHRKTEIIAKVFSRIPQRIIWRHTGELPTNLGSNIKILKWIPQSDMLGHAKTRLYIGHGGLNGAYEALYNAVPMILMPVLAPDQKDTAVRIFSKGMGLRLDPATITEESYYEAIKEVLQNDT